MLFVRLVLGVGNDGVLVVFGDWVDFWEDSIVGDGINDENIFVLVIRNVWMLFRRICCLFFLWIIFGLFLVLFVDVVIFFIFILFSESWKVINLGGWEFVFSGILVLIWNEILCIWICILLIMFWRKLVMKVGSDRVWLVLNDDLLLFLGLFMVIEVLRFCDFVISVCFSFFFFDIGCVFRNDCVRLVVVGMILLVVCYFFFFFDCCCFIFCCDIILSWILILLILVMIGFVKMFMGIVICKMRILVFWIEKVGGSFKSFFSFYFILWYVRIDSFCNKLWKYFKVSIKN